MAARSPGWPTLPRPHPPLIDSSCRVSSQRTPTRNRYCNYTRRSGKSQVIRSPQQRSRGTGDTEHSDSTGIARCRSWLRCSSVTEFRAPISLTFPQVRPVGLLPASEWVIARREFVMGSGAKGCPMFRNLPGFVFAAAIALWASQQASAQPPAAGRRRRRKAVQPPIVDLTPVDLPERSQLHRRSTASRATAQHRQRS